MVRRDSQKATSSARKHDEPQQGAKTRYPSKYSDKYITLSQFLAEIMCERRASHLKTELPRFFWDTLPEWKQYYFYQLKLANRLVKLHQAGFILRAVNELKYTFSLKLKAIKELIIKYESEPELLREVIEQPIETVNQSGVFIRKKGALGRLDD